ncbi:MAG: bifunctional UDP-N-acetylmuramoyl-tripeptide:D-alanyl-D-alanine ligase/alanine racemase [Saprospiraceae bacterium]
MKYQAREIAAIIRSDPKSLVDPDSIIEFINTDTRQIETPETSLFFALRGSMHDGHDFIEEAIEKGIVNIVVRKIPRAHPVNINFFVVDDCLKAMQILAAAHRSQFRNLDVLGITGSNGKTTIKEWLYEMINDRQVVKSPKSFNSQTGVALSVWQIRHSDRLGIFEAGISQPGEMISLAKMIRPTLGLFTMIGDAHTEGFENQSEKLDEKLILFEDSETIIFEEDDVMVNMAIRDRFQNKRLYSWGWNQSATLFNIKEIKKLQYNTEVLIGYKKNTFKFSIPFIDTASIENAMHCLAVLLVLEISPSDINNGFQSLHNIPMRLEMKNGIQDSILINDTYNADVQAFKIALDFLSQQAGQREKVLILSDFMQTGLNSDDLNQLLAAIIQKHNIVHVIGVGRQVSRMGKYLDDRILFHHFEKTEDLIFNLQDMQLNKKAILVKGARIFKLEKVISALSQRAHTATLETDLQAIGHNLRMFFQHLQPGTKLIAVIKASAYGSGSEELAKFLEYRKVSYLAVAYIDEGVQLRKAGISVPIIILNPDRNGVLEMIKHNLEPEVYCIEQLLEILALMESYTAKPFNIHLKMDTGMSRLGFITSDIKTLCSILLKADHLRVMSIFSHLSSSEDDKDDEFTRSQVHLLDSMFETISGVLQYRPMKHVLNSAGILRFPEYHFDMVRLGLGLYGIDGTNSIQGKLEKAHTLKATVIQIKKITTTDFIGYNRRGTVESDGQLAVINIGYADGLLRFAGNRKYNVLIHGKNYPIVGNICMDLTIIDIGNDHGIQIGDEAIIFGKDKPVERLAEICGTIPYEILSRISSRVKRLYVQG